MGLPAKTLDFAQIAIEFLLLPARFSDSGAQRDPTAFRYESDLISHLERNHPQAKVDDVEDMVRDFLGHYHGLADWYRAVTWYRSLDLVFEDHQPKIDQNSLIRWRRTTAWLDGDALITRDFIHRYRRPAQPRELSGWGTYIVPKDHRLEHADDRRLLDIHTHLGGCTCVPMQWLRIMDGEIPLDWFRDIAQCPREALEEDWQRQRQAVLQALESFDHLRDHLGATAPLEDAPSEAARALWPERAMLMTAWDRLGRDPDDKFLADHLDRYLYGKNLFLQYFVQHPGGPPGLMNFRRFFSRPKARGPDMPETFKWHSHRLNVGFACESPRLAYIELRIGPEESAADYARFFQRWADMVEAGRPPAAPEIRFIVHFPRDDRAGRTIDTQPHFHDYLARMDRWSAALQDFRLTHPEYRDRIVGIDVCNIERGSPINLHSPYLRLLTGAEPVREKTFRQYDLKSPYLQSWRALAMDHRHIVPPDARRLGLSCHAGEDYYHPLDGLRSVWETVRHCKMIHGDRLGHALALGADIDEFTTVVAGSAVIPRGDLLDALVWFVRRLGNMPDPDNLRERAIRHVTDLIERLTLKVYGEVQHPDQLYRLLRLRHRVPLETCPREVDGAVFDLYWRELRDEDIRRKRIHRIPIPTDLADRRFTRPFTALQNHIVSELASEGLVIEVNPSSNLAVGDFPDMEKHPVFTIHRIAPHMKITVNCDDPGTFATRLEQEYGLMLAAMERRGMSPAEIDHLLDHLRRCARQAAFAWEQGV